MYTDTNLSLIILISWLANQLNCLNWFLCRIILHVSIHKLNQINKLLIKVASQLFKATWSWLKWSELINSLNLDVLYLAGWSRPEMEDNVDFYWMIWTGWTQPDVKDIVEQNNGPLMQHLDELDRAAGLDTEEQIVKQKTISEKIEMKKTYWSILKVRCLNNIC